MDMYMYIYISKYTNIYTFIHKIPGGLSLFLLSSKADTNFLDNDSSNVKITSFPLV